MDEPKSKDELISELNALRLRVAESERMSMELQDSVLNKQEHIATVSHELRTPVTIIRESISQILDGVLGSANREQTSFLRTCLEEIDRLTRIINDLLDVSKLEAGKTVLRREFVDFAALAKQVSQTFKPLARSRGLELKTRFPNREVQLYADPDKTVQLITNLVGNAVKFTEKGFIEVSVSEESGEVVCSVKDTGIGIAPPDQSKIFSKFTQAGKRNERKSKGTGLGLAISKGIAELHEGKLWVTSKLGKGSIFSFSYPKHSSTELLKAYLADELHEAIERETALSVLWIGLKDFKKFQTEQNAEYVDVLLREFDRLVKEKLRSGDK